MLTSFNTAKIKKIEIPRQTYSLQYMLWCVQGGGAGAGLDLRHEADVRAGGSGLDLPGTGSPRRGDRLRQDNSCSGL